MVRMAFSLIALAAACGDDIVAYDLYEAEPAAFRTVTLWVEPHPEVPAALAREACESWRPEGVLCATVDDPLGALVRIRAVEAPCEKREDGSYTLGVAWVGGDVALMIGCLRKFGGTPIDVDLLWPVISHEVGHQLGIWDHVPTSCEEGEPSGHPEAGPACGVALMNPAVRRGLYGITLHDHHAYALRDEDRSVLQASAREACALAAADPPP